MDSINQMGPELIEASKKIWDFAELGLKEYRSSRLLARLLESRVFLLKWVLRVCLPHLSQHGVVENPLLVF